MTAVLGVVSVPKGRICESPHLLGAAASVGIEEKRSTRTDPEVSCSLNCASVEDEILAPVEAKP